MSYYELSDHFVVAAPLQETWSFFSAAENLPRITPPSLGFQIDTPAPITIKADSLLDYTIKFAGLPIRWRTRIIDWSPPRQFIDLQIRGPYALWHHQHTFTEVEDGIDCRDRVIYKLPASVLGRVIHWAAVRKQLMRIFQYRREVIGRELKWVRALQPDVEVRVL